MKKFLAFLFTVIISAGLTFVLVSSDFFMFNLVIKNEDKALQEINEVLAGYGYAKYYDLVINENIVNGEDSTVNTVSIKLSYDDTYGFDFVGHRKSSETSGGVTEVTEYDFYYIDGYMYVNNEEENSKTKTSRSFSNAMDSIITNYEVVLLGPIDISTEVVNDETTFNSSFAISGSPFYVGLNYAFHNGTAEDSTEYTITFTLDMLQNYRGIDYDVRLGTTTRRVKSTVLSYNKELTLTIPTDLDTYSVA